MKKLLTASIMVTILTAALCLTMSVSAANEITVTDEASFYQAIITINSSPATEYVINITNDVTITGNTELPNHPTTITSANGAKVIIESGNFYANAAITFENITIDGRSSYLFGNGHKITFGAGIKYEVNNCFSGVYGGNENGSSLPSSEIIINSGKFYEIFGGGYNSHVTNSTITINGGTISNLCGGGYNSNVTNSTITVNGGSIGNLLGGGYNGHVTNSTITVNDGYVGELYGDEFGTGAVDTSNITIYGGTISYIGTGYNVNESFIKYYSGNITTSIERLDTGSATGYIVADIFGNYDVNPFKYPDYIIDVNLYILKETEATLLDYIKELLFNNPIINLFKNGFNSLMNFIKSIFSPSVLSNLHEPSPSIELINEVYATLEGLTAVPETPSNIIPEINVPTIVENIFDKILGVFNP